MDTTISTVGGDSVTECWLDTILSVLENATKLFDEEGDMGNEIMDDPVSGYPSETKLESTGARGKRGRTSQKQRLKNRVNKYLTSPGSSDRSSTRKNGTAAWAPQDQIIMNHIEEEIQSERVEKQKPFDVAELEIPDDASEVTLPVSIRNKLFGIDFSPKKEYDDLTQPELETRPLAILLVKNEEARRELAYRGLFSLDTGEKCTSIKEERSRSEITPVVQSGLFTKNTVALNSKMEERELSQNPQRDVQEQFSRDLGDVLVNQVPHKPKNSVNTTEVPQCVRRESRAASPGIAIHSGKSMVLQPGSLRL